MNIQLCDIKPGFKVDRKHPYQIPVIVSQMSFRACKSCFDYAGEIDEHQCSDCDTCGYTTNKHGYLYDVVIRFGTMYGIVILESGEIIRVPTSQIKVLEVPPLSIDPMKDGDEY